MPKAPQKKLPNATNSHQNKIRKILKERTNERNKVLKDIDNCKTDVTNRQSLCEEIEVDAKKFSASIEKLL